MIDSQDIFGITAKEVLTHDSSQCPSVGQLVFGAFQNRGVYYSVVDRFVVFVAVYAIFSYLFYFS